MNAERKPVHPAAWAGVALLLAGAAGTVWTGDFRLLWTGFLLLVLGAVVAAWRTTS